MPAIYPDTHGLTPGTFGDMFGGANALFSGLAFLGVIVAILMQKDDLKLQRQELEFTRKELEGQKEQLEMQNRTMQKQQFENTFFQMIGLYNDIVNSIHIKQGYNDSKKARLAISEIYNHSINNCKSNIDADINIFKENFRNFSLTYNNDLGHYYRIIHNTLEFIDKSEQEDKEFYTSILRAQFSRYEIALIALDCFCDDRYNTFFKRMKKYNMFKHIIKAYIPREDIYQTIISSPTNQIDLQT